MNTTTHALIGLALLAKRGDAPRNRAVLFGALLPDIAIFIWGAWHMLVLRTDPELLWGTLYFGPFMQGVIAPINSVPIFAVLAIIGAWQRRSRWGLLILVFSVSALLHIAFDLPVHSEDAYRHFWPLTDWRYNSPLSYWNSEENARLVILFEATIAAICGVVLWRRFPRWWKRALTALIAGSTVVLSTMIFIAWS